MKIDIICDVIDNYGDAGVCLRLGRDLSIKNNQVRIYCNNIEAINKLTTKEDINNIEILSWPSEDTIYKASRVVIQAFSVRIPLNMLASVKENKSVVINLEYLTAESFADDCHKLPSYSDGIESFFFFPGFTDKTGSLVIEDDLRAKIKLSKQENTNKVTVFSYENKKVLNLIKKINKLNKDFEFLIFEGKSLDNFNKLAETNILPGEIYSYDGINIKGSCMVDHKEYDNILIDSDINLVRGEDSIVRAMLIGKPFLWNIYPTDDNAHFDKISALFDLMNQKLDCKEDIETLRNITLSYNGFSDFIETVDIISFYDNWKKLSQNWSKYLLSHKSLTENLLTFISEKLSNNDK